jgi:hypothetical protein
VLVASYAEVVIADDALRVDCDDLEVPSAGISRRRTYPSRASRGPAAAAGVTSDDLVLAQLTGVDVPASERVGEPYREVRRAGGGARAFRGWTVGRRMSS